mgnify:CR=1 FL=1
MHAPRPLQEVAHDLGLMPDHVVPYGRGKAKIDLAALATPPRGKGRLILVSAINPTPAGEGKTTTSISLALGMQRRGKNAVLALREPSLGPVFGTAGDLVKLVNKTVRGDLDAPGAIRFAVQNTPFLNLFYARPALDYFVLHPLYESMKPGYISRMEHESQKRYGQDMWWY